jgi:SAM-dependent methyltransferase
VPSSAAEVQPDNERDMDRWLGLDPDAARDFDHRTALRRYGHHRLQPGDLHYGLIRDLYERLSSEQRARLLDLGSGYGRIGLYGGKVFGIAYTGIELVEERVREAERARQAIGLDSRVFFQVGDALTADWPAATCVCLMNSFLPSQFPVALERLRAELEPGTAIAAVSTFAATLAREPWVEELSPSGGVPMLSLRLFARR